MVNICVIKTNLIQHLTSVYFVIQPLQVSAIFIDSHQEVYCIYIKFRFAMRLRPGSHVLGVRLQTQHGISRQRTVCLSIYDWKWRLNLFKRNTVCMITFLAPDWAPWAV